MAPMAAPFINFGGRDFTDRPVPAPWIQGDPADSVYRLAREALNNGDYGRASRLFGEVTQKYNGKSQLVDASQYFEALARYKIGTTDELHQAAKILKPLVAKLPVRTSTASNNEGMTPVKVSVGFGARLRRIRLHADDGLQGRLQRLRGGCALQSGERYARPAR